MVVASSGWIQNATLSPSHNNSNLNTSNKQNSKMAAKVVLICRANSHPFQERTVTLEQPVKIGRSVARARAAANNAIFDCKVLSRNHALLWYEAGKFYLQDTKSSNGTFVNNQRLSTGGQESMPREVCSGDIVQFGVDVMENTRKVTHGCIVATLKLFLPDGKEAKASPSTSVASPASNVSLEDLYKLNQFVQEANRREEVLNGKLSYLQRLVESTKQAADQSWKALIDEDRLLSRVETVESQLAACSKNFTEDKIRNELVKLQEDKAQYQTTAKETLQKILHEKLEVTQKLAHLERQLNDTEEECQSLHEVAKHTQSELQELARKYTEAQKKLGELSNKLDENEEKIREIVQKSNQEKQDLLERLENQSRMEMSLEARLKNSRLDSVNIHKQVTALRNYMQTLQDMNLKLISDENSESKDEMNPIEAINTILNTLNSMPMDISDSDQESNSLLSEVEQDNQINSQEIDSNQMKIVNSDHAYVKTNLDDLLMESDNVTEYILPPPSRRTLVNGSVNVENLDSSLESDTNSDATDDTCSVTSDDASEKSVIEFRRTEEDSTPTKVVSLPTKLEVRFASDENGEQLEVHYEPEDQVVEEIEIPESLEENLASQQTQNSLERVVGSPEAQTNDIIQSETQEIQEEDEECEGEHLEGDYIKTLKPISKSESIQQSLHSREYVLQTLIGSLDSLNGEDDLEAQQLARKELEDLREWLIHESNETVINKLKELYYRAKNETQRIREVNEELVILKEKYNVCTEEKTELAKKHEVLRTQCGDLLNATYTVPIQYVVPIAIGLLWMIFEKIF